MTQLTVLSPPAEAPVSLEAVKAFLRIGDARDDDLISNLLQSARERLEHVAGLALVTQTLRVTWRSWPAAIQGRGARLPIGPARQLDGVRLVDAEARATDYSDHFQLACGRICLRPWSRLPRVPTGGQIEIDLQAGFGSASQVPEDLREALLHLIGAVYSAHARGNFDLTTDALPAAVQAILDARKEVRL